MNQKKYNDFEIKTRKRLFIQYYCPYDDNEIESAIKLSLEFNKNEKWLYEVSKKYPDKSLKDVIKIEINK